MTASTLALAPVAQAVDPSRPDPAPPDSAPAPDPDPADPAPAPAPAPDPAPAPAPAPAPDPAPAPASAPDPAPDPDPDPGPGEDLLRVLVRALVAMLLAEAGGAALLLFALAHPWPATATLKEVAAYALGFGLGAGLAYACAEAAARWHVALGLLAGVLLSPLAPLAASFEQHLLATRDVVAATRSVAAAAGALTPALLHSCGAGALLVHGPALVAWRRGVRLPGRIAACAWGGALFSLAAAPVAGPFDAARLSTCWALLAARCAIFPAGQWLGDLAGGWVSRRVRRAPPEPRPERPRAPLVRALVAPLALLLPLPVLAWAALRPGPQAAPSWVVAAWTLHEPGAAWDLADRLLRRPRRPPGGALRLDLPGVAAAHGASLPERDQVRIGELLLRRAADGGHVRAMTCLAERIGARRPVEAEAWLRRAALLGDVDAAWDLGTRLLHGWVVQGEVVAPPRASDRDEALRWLRHAGRRGHGLEELLRHGIPPAEVLDLARAHARDAATEGAALRLERLLLRWPHLRRARLDDALRPPPRPWSPAALVTDLAPALPAALPGAADPDLERALAALRAGDLAEAVRRAERALDRAPEHPGALTLLGVAALLRARASDPIDGREADLAIAYLARAERAAPRDPTVLAPLVLAHAHRALRGFPLDMHATSEAFERLALLEAQGDPDARTLRRRLDARLGHVAPLVGPERAEAALAARQAAWRRHE